MTRRSGIPLLSLRNHRCRRDTGYHLHPGKQRSRISLGSYHLGRQRLGISISGDEKTKRSGSGDKEGTKPGNSETRMTEN